MTEREPHGCVDAAQVILADLGVQQSRRRRHFAPALGIAMIAVAGPMLVIGLRPDLLAQPAWQLALQCLLWLLCLIVFPAIGLGLVFPSRGVRIGLAGGAAGLTLLATLGGPAGLTEDHGHSGTACSLLVVFYAVAVLLMGLLSGAFVQRRRTSGVYWIAAGVSLTALSAITWQCPQTGVAHVLPSHLAVAAVLMIATSAVGIMVHRRRRAQLGA